jgi:hypothetical protein
MNHQHFKEWLISEEPLSLEQSQELEVHIKDCVSCQQLQTAWSDVHHIIKDTTDVDPMPGFTSRWEMRWKQQHKHAQKRLIWIVSTSLASIAIFVSFLLSLQLFELIRSPEQVALVFISRFAVLISYLTITKDYLNFLSIYLPRVSFPIIVFAFGMMTLLCVIWLATMKQISRAWRIAK